MDQNSQNTETLFDMKQKAQNYFNKYLKGLSGWVIIIVIIAIWASQGFYTINPAEVGLVKRFGKHTKTVGPGLHFHIPAPVESVVPVDIRSVRKIEVGYTTISQPPNPRYRTNSEEALILTSDGNIVHIEFAVQYKVKNPEKYAFNLIEPQAITKEMVEAIIREEVAKRDFTEIITTSRAEIAQDTYTDLQKLLDRYNTGIVVENVKLQDVKPPEPVSSAFDDVNSAAEDKETYVNQANAYANKVIPKAEGKAAQITNTAEAYKAEKVAGAQGDVAKFKNVLAKYNTGSQEITRTRLYIETLEKILPETNKILTTGEAANNGVLKLLDLNKIQNQEESGGEK